MPCLITEKYRYLREVLYNKKIARQLGSVGAGSVIARPCMLQGGGLANIRIGSNTRIQPHSVLECWTRFGKQEFSPEITIGDNCKIGEYCHITSCNGITIGNGLLTGRYVLITDNSHGGLSLENSGTAPIDRPLESKGKVVIGDNVWLGDKVTVLPGVRIGDNVIVGANSVVTKDIPSNSMAAGIPAKVLKHLP